MKKKYYIGEFKIKNTKNDGEHVTINFNNNPPVKMQKDLFNLVKTEIKGVGNITDNVRAKIASEFLIKIAKYDLEVIEVNSIAFALDTLAKNTKEEIIAKKFNVDNIHAIKVRDLIPCYEK